MGRLENERSRLIAELREATVELSQLAGRISILTEKINELDRLQIEYAQSAVENLTPVTNYIEAQLVRKV
jgi:hypothetical protein